MITNNILVISDDDFLSTSIKQELTFKGGYSVQIASSTRVAVDALKTKNFDLVIAKYAMLDLKGINLVRELRKIDNDCIIITIADKVDSGTLHDIGRLGIYEFFTKPLNLDKFNFVIRKGIELHALLASNRKFMHSLNEHNVSLQKQNILLAKRIEGATQNLTRLYEELRSTYLRTIKTLAQAIDARDHYTHSHSENVSKVAVIIAKELNLTSKDIEIIRQACELHDLGKIGVQDNILSKEEPLTSQDWEQIRQHSLKGAQILEPLNFLASVVDLVRQHHEHWDGSGYPDGLKGEEILLGARIINLADAYDAMTSARSYRKIPFTKSEAIEEIKKNSGSQFDPKVVEIFLSIKDNL